MTGRDEVRIETLVRELAAGKTVEQAMLAAGYVAETAMQGRIEHDGRLVSPHNHPAVAVRLAEFQMMAARRAAVTIDDIVARLDDGAGATQAGAIQDGELLVQLGTMVEYHNRKMTLPMLAWRTKLIRNLAGAVGADITTFREKFNARGKLIEQQHRGDCDPEELSAAIDAATEALYGPHPEATVAKVARDRGDDPAQAVERFESEAAEADRIGLRLMSSKIRTSQQPADDAKLENAQIPPHSVERRSGRVVGGVRGFIGSVHGMNNYVKMAIIIGISMILAVAINVYFSPFQTCKREMESSSDYKTSLNAAAYCARALGR